MLKKFEVSNFKNFQKRICLDLYRVNNYSFNERLSGFQKV